MMHITYFMERLEINGIFESRRTLIRNSLSINELQPRTCERFLCAKIFYRLSRVRNVLEGSLVLANGSHLHLLAGA